jgi:hypothetical protein
MPRNYEENDASRKANLARYEWRKAHPEEAAQQNAERKRQDEADYAEARRQRKLKDAAILAPFKEAKVALDAEDPNWPYRQVSRFSRLRLGSEWFRKSQPKPCCWDDIWVNLQDRYVIDKIMKGSVPFVEHVANGKQLTWIPFEEIQQKGLVLYKHPYTNAERPYYFSNAFDKQVYIDLDKVYVKVGFEEEGVIRVQQAANRRRNQQREREAAAAAIAARETEARDREVAAREAKDAKIKSGELVWARYIGTEMSEAGMQSPTEYTVLRQGWMPLEEAIQSYSRILSSEYKKSLNRPISPPEPYTDAKVYDPKPQGGTRRRYGKKRKTRRVNS